MDSTDSVGNSSGRPEPIPFSLTLAGLETVEGTLAIIPYVGDSRVVALELQLAGIPTGSAALTEESALDLALRLVGAVMKRRRGSYIEIDRRGDQSDAMVGCRREG